GSSCALVPGFGRFDHAAAEAHFAVIENHGLAWGHGALWFVEYGAIAVLGFLQGAILITLTVAHLGCDAARSAEVHRIDPVDLRGEQGAGEQPGMFVALVDDQYIARQILAQHVPGIVAGVLEATDAKALTLTDGVVHQAMMATDDLAFGSFDIPGLSRQVLLEEIAEAALADKADSGRVLLLRGGQLVFLGDGAYLRFFQFADREQGLGDLLTANGMQEVALILVRIQALE